MFLDLFEIYVKNNFMININNINSSLGYQSGICFEIAVETKDAGIPTEDFIVGWGAGIEQNRIEVSGTAGNGFRPNKSDEFPYKAGHDPLLVIEAIEIPFQAESFYRYLLDKTESQAFLNRRV